MTDLEDGIDIIRAIPCRKRYLLVQRVDATSAFQSSFVPSNEFNNELHDIVGLFNWPFDPYLIFFDQNDQDSIYYCIVELVMEACRAGYIHFPRAEARLPRELKQAYLQTLRALRIIADGCYVTQLFLHRLREMFLRAWRHGLAYRKFNTKFLAYSSLRLETPFVC